MNHTKLSRQWNNEGFEIPIHGRVFNSRNGQRELFYRIRTGSSH